MYAVVDGAGRAGEVEDVINFAAVEGFADIVFLQFKTVVIAQVIQVRLTPGNEIVYRDYCVTLA